jgi:hypothetical protein
LTEVKNKAPANQTSGSDFGKARGKSEGYLLPAPRMPLPPLKRETLPRDQKPLQVILAPRLNPS